MRTSATKRIAVGIFTIVVLLGSGLALADPLSDLQQQLLPVKNVRATGVGPTTIFLTFVDQSAVESGFWVEVAIGDEAGEYKRVGTALKACVQTPGIQASGTFAPPKECVTSIENTAIGVPASDPRTLFFRVVPFVELTDPQAKSQEPGNGILLFNGQPSYPDAAMLGPKRPTDLLCNGGGLTACTNVTSVTLTWTDNAEDEQGYWIMRSRNGAAFERKAELGPDVVSFTESILDDFGAKMRYKVVAFRRRAVLRLDGSVGAGLGEEIEFSTADSGLSETSNNSPGNITQVDVDVAPVPSPSNPKNLRGTFTAPSTMTITWDDLPDDGRPYIDEDGWFIEIAPENDPNKFESMWSAPRTPGPGVGRSYTDRTLVPDRARCYRVRGYRHGKDGVFPAVSAYTMEPNAVCVGAIPKAPTNLTATARSNASVHLEWRDVSTHEEAFVVERCVGVCAATGAWVVIENAVPANTTMFTDENTLALTTYSYRVSARNTTGRSAPSNIAVVTTPAAPLPKPTSLTAVGRSHAIFLTWADNASNETAYQVEYHEDGEDDWKVLTDDLPPNTEAYLDTFQLGTNHRRFYRVRAMKGSGVSDPSNVADATTLGRMAPNGAPSDVTATCAQGETSACGVQSNASVILRWFDNSTNETAFRIEYGVVANTHCADASPPLGSFRVLGNVVPKDSAGNPYDVNLTGPRSYRVTGLLPHSSYYFRVKAVNPDGESDWGLRSGVTTRTGNILETITACAQTYGPPKPAFRDPSANGQLNATRCNFTVAAARATRPDETSPWVDHHDKVGGLLVHVTAHVAESGIAHTDTLYVVADGGRVPGQRHDPERAHFVYLQDGPNNYDYEFSFADSDPNNWVIPYLFRRGITYKIRVTAFLEAAPYWGSAESIVSDVKVVADCPVPNRNVPA